MANLLKRRPSTDVAQVGNQTAAVQRMDLPPMDTGWSLWRQAGSPLLWQQEVYRHYDRNGELHFSGNVVASMISRCNVGIWEKTEDGEPGKPVTEGPVAKLSAQLGGGSERPETLRLSGLNDFLVGDYYTVVEDDPDVPGTDRWFTLSVSQIRRSGNYTLVFDRPIKYGGGEVRYQLPRRKGDKPKNTVLLWRTFTEHAQLTDHPDSSVRAAIPILNLIEQYDKRSSAQNDSRLAGAGVLFLPSGFDFPVPPPGPPGPPGSPAGPTTPVEAFEARLGDAMGKTLKDPANARALVPIMATVEADLIEKVRWLTFETPLDEQTMARLDQCIRRLGLSLDMPPELLTGMGGINHWGQWATEQSTQKTFVAPRLARWCQAVTVAWMTAKMRLMNIDPAKYMVWFDMSPLTVRPDRQEDALALWDRGLVTNETVLEAGNWPKTAAHTKDTYKTWLLTQAVIKNPQLLIEAALGDVIAKATGIKIEAAPAQPAITAGGDAQAPAEPAAAGGTPAEPTSTRTPAQEALVAGAEMAAMHSLAVAGKKLLNREVRETLLNEFSGRTFDLHTRVTVRDTDHAVSLLEGTWDLLPALAARTGTDVRILRESLGAYCARQLTAARPHDPDALTMFLSEGILAAEHRFCGPAGCRNQLHPNKCTPVYAVAS